MNRFQMFCALSLASLLSARSLAQDSLFPDPGLEAAVRAQVYAKRHNREPLTQEDVARISQIHGTGKMIKSLAGLDHCEAVQLLELGNNEIVDLSPLANLKLLQSLSLGKNKIESIEPLRELERLQLLDLSENQLKEISPLSKMSNMRTLYLSKNQIQDISVLRGLPKIWSLYLDGNPITDWAPVGELKWLSSFKASNCKLNDISFLKPLKRLSSVVLVDNEIESLLTLVEMAESDESRQFAQSWKLYLRGNKLEGATEQIEKLRSLGTRVILE